MSAEARVAELGLELPPAPKPVGVYKPALIVGDMCYLSGHGPLQSDGKLIRGRVGADMDQQGGYDAAKQTGLAMLVTLKSHLGSLDRVVRVVKVLGLVQCTPEFDRQPVVINGCSELFKSVFGDDPGVGTRSALGANALPGGMVVEIEAIFQISQ